MVVLVPVPSLGALGARVGVLGVLGISLMWEEGKGSDDDETLNLKVKVHVGWAVCGAANSVVWSYEGCELGEQGC
jgi:hypothetical protein